MSKVWFTSDLHFRHKNIVKFTNRGVHTTEDNHDEWLIQLWNATVAKGDVVYHLGDLSFARHAEDTLAILRQLNGTKHLIKGNHDYSKNFIRYSEISNVHTHDYLEKTFEFKLSPDHVRLQHVVMFHFPIGSYHRQSHGSWHLHGHCHGNYLDSKGKMLDVGIDSSYNLYGKHKFFDLKMISEYMHDRPIYTADSHRENL